MQGFVFVAVLLVFFFYSLFFVFAALIRDILDEVDRQYDQFDEAVKDEGGCRGGEDHWTNAC